MGELGRRTWRWFTVRISGLTGESAFSHALFPVDGETGKRARRAPLTVIDDADQVDAFFARQASS